eukprot:264224-Chlamydomonas_euryale.AAC.1
MPSVRTCNATCLSEQIGQNRCISNVRSKVQSKRAFKPNKGKKTGLKQKTMCAGPTKSGLKDRVCGLRKFAAAAWHVRPGAGKKSVAAAVTSEPPWLQEICACRLRLKNPRAITINLRLWLPLLQTLSTAEPSVSSGRASSLLPARRTPDGTSRGQQRVGSFSFWRNARSHVRA